MRGRYSSEGEFDPYRNEGADGYDTIEWAATSAEEAGTTWPKVADEYRSWLPLSELPYLRDVAPYYYEWLRHPPEDPWWDWAEFRGRYGVVDDAVLNLSGWFDAPNERHSRLVYCVSAIAALRYPCRLRAWLLE